MKTEERLREELKRNGHVYTGTDESLLEYYEELEYNDEDAVEHFVQDAIDYLNIGYPNDKGQLGESDESFFSNLHKI